MIKKTSVLGSLLIALCALAASAAPASAEFASQSGKGTGELVTKTTKLGNVTCSVGKGTWTVLSSVEKKEPVLKGSVLNQLILFSECQVEGAKEKAKIEPFKCEWQIASKGKETTGSESLLTPCVVKAPASGCEEKVAAKSESGASWSNFGTEELLIHTGMTGEASTGSEKCLTELWLKIKIEIVLDEGQILLISI